MTLVEKEEEIELSIDERERQREGEREKEQKIKSSCSRVVKCAHVHINEWLFCKRQIVAGARRSLLSLTLKLNA